MSNLELFSGKVMADIAKSANLTSQEDIDGLAVALREFGLEIRGVLASMPSDFKPHSPFDATLSERVDWLDTQVLNPLNRLLNALEPENRPYFSMWPHDVDEGLKRNLDELAEGLKVLQLMAQNTVINLVIHRRTKLPYNDLLRLHIVQRTAGILDDLVPNLKPSRGTYDRESKTFSGNYPHVIRTVFKEITGKEEPLDHLIKEVVELRREK